jgi:hypothetical protein
MASPRSTSDTQTRFLRKLEKIESNAELKSLLSECPSPTASAHRLYTNLAFFIEHFVPPRNTDASEVQVYIQLAHRLRRRGESDHVSREQTVAAFKVANKV